MAIPQNITKEHINNAIIEIDPENIPIQRVSERYLVISDGKSLPPKYVISIANKYANGVELDSESFNAIEAKDFLLKNKFEIIDKRTTSQITTNYYSELIKFLSQAKTNSLSTTNYLSTFKGLSVKVSFGIGNIARVPWIAFTNNFDKVQNGIYPVYLYYKNRNLLILAYGVSETYKPKREWNVDNVDTIEQYFEKNNLGKPERYGKSLVFRSYDLNKGIVESEIGSDLEKMISIYKENFDEKKIFIDSLKPFSFSSFHKSAINAGYFIEEMLCLRFCASLMTKPFVILTGLSGSGKTKLAQAFVQWICQDESQYRIVPVGADWTNREPLLGYPNALKTDEYVKPDSGVLDLIIQANENPDLPHFLILDEMNLSLVERYFADFLSAMESKEEIPLYADGDAENGVPAKLKVPTNLFIIGTVNIDETTNMFSPKVLDRANTIEFRVTRDEMKKFLGVLRNIDLDALVSEGAGMAKNFLDMSADKSFDTSDADEVNNTLIRFFSELKKSGAEFGYRSATEILRLISKLSVLDKEISTNNKLDIAIMQKLLPKLHGSRRKLCPVLETLGSFCISGDLKIVKDVFENKDFDFNGSDVLYPLSLEKITRMYRGAVDNGFASFAEA